MWSNFYKPIASSLRSKIDIYKYYLQYIETDPAYMKTSIGNYMFCLVNIREPYIVGVFDGRSHHNPILHAVSKPISFRDVNLPLQVHLSLGHNYTEMM